MGLRGVPIVVLSAEPNVLASAGSLIHLGGVTVIRAAILNHRTRRRDVERLVAVVGELGDRAPGG